MIVKDRILLFIQYLGISKSAFEKQVGLSNGYLNNFKGNIGSAKLEGVLSAFPELNRNWLLFGEGDMLVSEQPVAQLDTSPDAEGTPYYEVDFCGGFDFIINDQTAIPSGKINMPQYAKADCWVNITGHSMEPLISNGDIIALHRIDDWHTYILYGEIYGIMTDEYRTIKRVRKATNEDNIILEPLNPAFDTQEIPKSIIRQMWQVIGCIKKIF